MSTITGPFYISAIHLSAAPARGSRTIFEGVRAEPGGKPVNYKTLRYIFVTHFLPKALFRVRVLVPPLQNPISTSSANRTRLRNERGNRSDFVSLLFVQISNRFLFHFSALFSLLKSVLCQILNQIVVITRTCLDACCFRKKFGFGQSEKLQNNQQPAIILAYCFFGFLVIWGKTHPFRLQALGHVFMCQWQGGKQTIM